MSKRKKTAHSHRDTSSGFERFEASSYFAVVAFAVILVALVILFSDFVFSDEMLYASDQLNATFFRSFLVDQVVEHGSVPQWNPYIWGGMPYVEAFHGDIFYPGSVLKFILDAKRWQGWTWLIHIYLAGIFMYLAACQFKLSKISALFSAVCYMFAGYLVSLVAPGHDGKIYVTTLFPLAFFFLDRGFESRPVLNFSLLGLVIGFIILSPHPQMSYMTLWALGLYTLFKLIFLYIESKSFIPLIKPSVLAAGAVAAGLCLSAIQFYPGYVYTSNFSPRAETKKGWEWATSWSMHEEEAASIVLPELVGTRTSKATTYYWGKNVFKDNSETVGAVAILAALIGAVYYRRREAYFFIGLALFALSYALAGTTPIFKLYFYLIPKVDSMRSASMIMFLFSFSIAMLAGMGIQAVRDRVRGLVSGENPHFQYVLFGLPALLLVLALTFSMAGRSMLDLWCSLFFDNAASWEVQRGVTKFDLAVMNLPAIRTGAWLAFLFTGVASVLIWLYKTKKLGPWVLVGLAIIPVIDSVRFNSRFIQTVDQSTYAQRFEPNPVVNLLKSKPDKFRVMNLMNDQDNSFPYFGIEVPIGYHGNQLRWYDNLAGDLSRANRLKPGFLNLMGVKYLLAPADQGFPEGYLGDKPVTVEANFGRVDLLRNDNALPRVFLVDEYRVVPDRKQIYPQVVTDTRTLREVVILEEEPELQIPTDTMGTDSAWLIDHQPDSVVVGVTCTTNKILVLTDVYYDAWQVYIDGVPARLLRSYGALRAVEVPAGSRQVLFKYESERYRTGRLVTLLTMLFLVAIIGGHGLRVVVRRHKKAG